MKTPKLFIAEYAKEKNVASNLEELKKIGRKIKKVALHCMIIFTFSQAPLDSKLFQYNFTREFENTAKLVNVLK